MSELTAPMSVLDSTKSILCIPTAVADAPLMGHQSGGCSNQPQIETSFVIDRISICIPINKDIQGYVQGCLIELQKPSMYVPDEIGIRPGARGRYKVGIRIYQQSKSGTGSSSWGDAYMLLQAAPHAPAAHFLRIEWNPAKFGPGAFGRLSEIFELAIIELDAQQIVATAHVTRLDLAIDLKGVTVDNFHWDTARKRTRAIYVNRDGDLGTLYAGRKRQNCVVVYDKRHEQKLPLSSPPWTRVETRIKPQHPVKDLANLSNPFEAISVHDVLGAALPLPASDARAFLDSCHKRGLRNALQKRSSNDRPLFRQLIKEASVKWWQPTALWAAWEKSLLAALSC
jgi:hypothetical protein